MYCGGGVDFERDQSAAILERLGNAFPEENIRKAFELPGLGQSSMRQ
jgi:hypothetical protein